MVSNEILGIAGEVAIINSKRYWIAPPTIAKLAGAAMYLSAIGDANNVHDVLLNQLGIEAPAHALSWLIRGDDSLFGELCQATFDEVVGGIEIAYSQLSPANFLKLSLLTKNAMMAIAKPKQ